MNSIKGKNFIEKFFQYRRFVHTHGIFEFEEIKNFDDKKNAFFELIKTEYPKISQNKNRNYILKSQNSQLNLTTKRAIYNVDYFGNYNQDYELCNKYVTIKLNIALKGIKEIFKIPVRFIALITESETSFSGLDEKSIEFMVNNFLPSKFKDEPFADISLRMAYKEKNKFFINYIISNYIMRGISSDKFKPTNDKIHLKPHELEIVDAGVKTIVDINTKPDTFNKLADYDEADLTELLHLTYTCITKNIIKIFEKNYDTRNATS